MNAPGDTSGAGASRLRVAFLARRFGARFGGAEAYAEHILAELAQRHDIHVFCQEWDSRLPLAHTVLRRPAGLPRWLNLWLFSRQCARLVAGYDVVHSHENTPLGQVQGVHVMPVRYGRQQRDRTMLQRLRTACSLRWQAYLHMEAARYRPAADKVLIVASELIDEQIAQVYPVTAKRVVVTPGVHVPAGVPTREEARRQLGLPEGVPMAVLIANDPWRKGLTAILEAMQLPGEPDWQLMVVGGEPGTAARVQRATQQAGLGERVRAWDGRADVWPFYAAADFCLFPTLGDAFGMVPLEAMALGRPVILSSAAYCGFASEVQHGKDALVLEQPRDAGEMAAAVRRLLQDSDLAQSLSAGGIALSRRFLWPALAARIEAEYEQVLEARKSLARNFFSR